MGVLLICRQLFALVCKNLLLRKRHYIQTGFEIILPIVISLALNAFPSLNSIGMSSSNVEKPHFYPPESVNTSVNPGHYTNDDKYMLAYTPINNEATKIMEKLTKRFEKTRFQSKVQLKGFDTESEMIKEYQLQLKNSDNHMTEFAIGIVFKEISKTSFKYVIRSDSPSTGDKFKFSKTASFLSSYDSFMWYQYNLDDIYMEWLGGPPKSDKLYSQYFPHGSYTKQSALVFLPFMATIVMGIMLTVVILLLVIRVIQEKNTGMREYLRSMGLSNAVNYISWFIHGMIVLFVVCLFTLLSLSCPIFSGKPIFYNSDTALLFVFLLMYSTSLVLSILFLTIFFKKGLIGVMFIFMFLQATTIGPILGMDNMIILFNFESIDRSLKMLSCLLPNTALYWLLRITFSLQIAGKDFKAEYLNTPVIKNDSFCLSDVFGMMAASWVFYIVLIWYFDNVWPWQTGVPRPFYFFLTKSYWFGSDRSDRLTTAKNENKELHEEVPSSQKIGISIENLTKSFTSGFKSKIAVDNLSMSIYENQITALLGHNGAGKTTTISMITGLFAPNSGDVVVNGYSILDNLTSARQSMGYCPQFSIIIPELTVKEHLQLVTWLRTVNTANLDTEITNILKALNLSSKKDALSSTLSGGMKRKLSIAMALMGNTKVLLLDEPTTGLDPEARREIWDILQNIRTGRTIILTTHYMEEADALGDRIVIMADGNAYCSGSSMFLKNQFGAGYHLRMITKDGCDIESISSFISNYVPATIERHSGRELSFFISTDSKENFPEMLKNFENSLESLKIETFGLSVTNMEDVFLKVGEATKKESDASSEEIAASNKNLSEMLAENSRERASFTMRGFQQFYGLIVKRLSYNIRQISSLVLQVVIPISICVCLAIALRTTNSGPAEDSDAVDMDMTLYSDSTTLVKSDDSTLTKYLKNMLDDKTKIEMVGSVTKEAMKVSQDNFGDYVYKYIIGVEVNSSSTLTTINGLSNSFAIHGLPISLNLADNLKLKSFAPKASIYTQTNPLPSKRMGPMSTKLVASLFIAIFFPMIITLVTSFSGMFIIAERVSKSKHLQLMTGLHPWVLWIAHFFWDFLICFSILMVVFIICITTSEIGSYSSLSASLFLLFILYNAASIQLVYLTTWLFNGPIKNFVINLLFHMIAGLIIGLTNVMINYGFTTDQSKKDSFNNALHFVDLLPSVSLTNSFMSLNRQSIVNKMCHGQDLKKICGDPVSAISYKDCCKENDRPYNPLGFEQNECGEQALKLFFLALFIFVLTLVCEHPFIKSKLMILKTNIMNSFNHGSTSSILESIPMSKIDDDVVKEEQDIDNLIARNEHLDHKYRNYLIVDRLRKQYGNVLAVNKISFKVSTNECFGLLGINGAGKTTTFSILTGDLNLTSGDGYICPYSLSNDLGKFQQQIGYCPQFDALLELLTGEEQLYLFARLQCIPSQKIKPLVNSLINLVNLEEHAKKKCGTYSGGNKRKLSLACAIIGAPPLLFLDEPTAGIDPVSRRHIWQLLTNLKSYGTSIVLTSHSMEECEALCDRLTIMVKGNLQCIGEVTYLKNKFGKGFTLLVKCKLLNDGVDDRRIEAVTNHIVSAIPSSECISKNIGILTFHIRDTTLQWSTMFSAMEKAKKDLELEDYSISATSLEQVFISFATENNQATQVLQPNSTVIVMY